MKICQCGRGHYKGDYMRFIVTNMTIDGFTTPGVVAHDTDFAYYLAQEEGATKETYRIVNTRTGLVQSSGWHFHQTCQDMIGIATRARVAVLV